MTQRIAATTEEAQKIAELLRAPFPVTLGVIAKALGTTELGAAQRLPADSVAFVTGDTTQRFDEIWASLATWEKATTLILHGGHVFEVSSKISTGKRAQGYYNIMAKDAVLGGHIRYEEIGAIAFITIPFMGRESHFVQFFGQDGSASFSVYVGRENHQLIPSVVQAFQDAKKKFCA